MRAQILSDNSTLLTFRVCEVVNMCDCRMQGGSTFNVRRENLRVGSTYVFFPLSLPLFSLSSLETERTAAERWSPTSAVGHRRGVAGAGRRTERRHEDIACLDGTTFQTMAKIYTQTKSGRESRLSQSRVPWHRKIGAGARGSLAYPYDGEVRNSGTPGGNSRNFGK